MSRDITGWQVQDSNLRRRKPTDLQSVPLALDNRMEFGVLGGMTERQRRAAKQHPEVDSWAEFFAAQREHRNASQPA